MGAREELVSHRRAQLLSESDDLSAAEAWADEVLEMARAVDEEERPGLEPRPIERGIPELLATGPPVYTGYFGHADDALDCAAAAERLGLGYELVAYYAPSGESREKRELRLTVWQDVTADCGPMVSQDGVDA